MNIALVYDNHEYQNTTAMLLDDAGYTVNLAFSIESPWVAAIKNEAPDILVISIGSPDDTLLQQLSIFRDNIICPVVVLAMQADVDITEKTMLAGAHSCITGKISAERMQSFIRVTITRYKINLNQIKIITELKQEIISLEDRLNDRRDIARAKGLLMQSYKMNEVDAYNALRKMAMDTGNKLGEVSRNLISMSKVLN
ncbi:MAG: ANTAR domain-containing protein [Gammaproteobacteria bacterium]|nr:ANTAR domain-containing protein [Gammaproteobacteria bacterium]MCW8911389.1 ANTAR domain-containing protein [Gammaproteobacteria bacterium]MCW9006208.1 ANTAR domain-containing protein [Gammaproteobacteria bacterium]MCW9056227.1 ANTAR domain-containing protein [Gammaproteobacteria bacterium]